jgi:hypothetical protein
LSNKLDLLESPVNTGDFLVAAIMHFSQKNSIHDISHLLCDEKARTRSLDELAVPFRKVLKGASEEEIAQIVSKSRSRQRR